MRKMSRLESLDLTCTEATDAGMDYVGEMKGLEYLTLNSYVGDVGVVKLRGLTNLKELGLHSSKITDACLSLTAFTQLRRLNLWPFTRYGGRRGPPSRNEESLH